MKRNTLFKENLNFLPVVSKIEPRKIIKIPKYSLIVNLSPKNIAAEIVVQIKIKANKGTTWETSSIFIALK